MTDETVYVNTELRSNVPIGSIEDYVNLNETETAVRLYQRLNRNRASGQIVSMQKCVEYAAPLVEKCLNLYLGDPYPGHNGSEVHLEMAQAGAYHPKGQPDPKDKNTISLWIYGEKRPMKHFHFYRGKDRKAGGCIRLDKPEYFPHDGHTDTLGEDEVLDLVKFLQTVNPEGGWTIWKTILFLWNTQNLDCKIEMNAPIPPYRMALNDHRYSEREKS